MAVTGAINVRLDEQLKESGGRVLDCFGVSPSELVRSVYRYMAKTQRIPPCLDVAELSPDGASGKRAALRGLVDTDSSDGSSHGQ